jgi:hypothetical protein
MTDEPEYTTMSGAEFKRTVGADPEKWAYACLTHGRASVSGTTPPPREAPPAEQVEFLARWFRDAMDAAVKAAKGDPCPSA